MSTKKLLPWPVAEKFFVSISSLLSADRSSIAREVLLWILFRFLGSFSIGDNVRRLLKLGKRLDLGNHGSIRGSWPIAISGSPRGPSVRTVTRCRSTQGRTSYLILPSNRASQEPNCPPPRDDGTSSLPETLKLLADVILWRRSTLLSSKSSR